MLDALETIHNAEEAIEQRKKDLQNELKQYSEEKAADIERRKGQNQLLLNQLISEKEEAEERALQQARELLLAEAKEVRENLQEQYEKTYQQAIDLIIGRVKETYGSH